MVSHKYDLLLLVQASIVVASSVHLLNASISCCLHYLNSFFSLSLLSSLSSDDMIPRKRCLWLIEQLNYGHKKLIGLFLCSSLVFGCFFGRGKDSSSTWSCIGSLKLSFIQLYWEWSYNSLD